MHELSKYFFSLVEGDAPLGPNAASHDHEYRSIVTLSFPYFIGAQKIYGAIS